MTTATLEATRLRGGESVPPLRMTLADGGVWSLAESRPEIFTIVWVIRGVHCSFCKAEVEALARRRDEYARIGCDIAVVSMDDDGRAARMASEWDTGDLLVGHGLTEVTARAWGLYLSTKVKDSEPALFAEPGAYLVRRDGTLYAQFQATSPWLRLDIDTMLRGITLALERGTPPRGLY